MIDAPVVLLLAVASACLVIITVTLVTTARQFRGTLRQVNDLLPDAARTLRETRQSAQQVHELLARGNNAVHMVETVIHAVRNTATTALEHLPFFNGGKARILRHWKNGMGADPRPSDRPKKKGSSRRHNTH